MYFHLKMTSFNEYTFKIILFIKIIPSLLSFNQLFTLFMGDKKMRSLHSLTRAREQRERRDWFFFFFLNSDWQKLVNWRHQNYKENMKRGSWFYTEFLDIEVLFFFHGWREFMTEIYQAEKKGIYKDSVLIINKVNRILMK